MFPLSHTYVTRSATGRADPLLIFGSVLPDIASISANLVGRDKIHDSPREFYSFVETYFPQLIDLALGVRLHSHIDGGADRFSDDRDTGYAYLHGKDIFSDVEMLFGGLPKDAVMIFAHNFIESAVDLHISTDIPETWELYRSVLAGISHDHASITRCVAEYLSVSEESVENELQRFISMMSAENLRSPEALITNIAIPLVKNVAHQEMPVDESVSIMQKAFEITQDSYKTFLDTAAEQVRKNILMAIP